MIPCVLSAPFPMQAMLSNVASGGSWKRVIRVPAATSPYRPRHGDVVVPPLPMTPLYRSQPTSESPLTGQTTSTFASPPLASHSYSSHHWQQQQQRQRSPPSSPSTSRPLIHLYSSTPPSSSGPRLSRQALGSMLQTSPAPAGSGGEGDTDRLVELVGRYANCPTSGSEAQPSPGNYNR